MEAAVVVALAIAIPVILFPVALVWYINIGGLRAAAREARERRAIIEQAETVAAK
jgi:hypothetical protein